MPTIAAPRFAASAASVLVAAYLSVVYAVAFVLPPWLGWTAAIAGVLLFLEGFGLGGVINTFGLVVDLIGFVLFLVFVLASSIVMLRRGDPVASNA